MTLTVSPTASSVYLYASTQTINVVFLWRPSDNKMKTKRSEGEDPDRFGRSETCIYGIVLPHQRVIIRGGETNLDYFYKKNRYVPSGDSYGAGTDIS